MITTKTQKSTFVVAFFIQKQKLRSDGKTTIFCRMVVNGQTAIFSTKLIIDPDRWSTSEHRTLGKSKEEKEINELLEEFRSMIKRRYHEKVNLGEKIDVTTLRNSVLSLEDKCITLLPLCNKFIEDYYKLVLSKSVVKDTYQRYVYTL